MLLKLWFTFMIFGIISMGAFLIFKDTQLYQAKNVSALLFLVCISGVLVCALIKVWTW